MTASDIIKIFMSGTSQAGMKLLFVIRPQPAICNFYAVISVAR